MFQLSNTAPKRRAFLVQVGINQYAASGCRLEDAVNDAEVMRAMLSERLRGRYQIVAIPLESAKQGQENVAGKEAVRLALADIASKATPDDIFVMSFSGHGYSADDEEFYLLPSDVPGTCDAPQPEVLASMLEHSISADELAQWLRPIDASEMTLVLDACQSAASVEKPGFRPGPMGSKGLGQLAYDKRMRVLAGSQSTEVAREYRYLHDGLLTYVLTHDGLQEQQADWKPKDQSIRLGEWLAYAANAVPRFTPPRNGGSDAKAFSNTVAFSRESQGVQRPALFDFSTTDTLEIQRTTAGSGH